MLGKQPLDKGLILQVALDKGEGGVQVVLEAARHVVHADDRHAQLLGGEARHVRADEARRASDQHLLPSTGAPLWRGGAGRGAQAVRHAVPAATTAAAAAAAAAAKERVQHAKEQKQTDRANSHIARL